MNKDDALPTKELTYYRKQAAKTRKLAQEAAFTAGHVDYLVTQVETLQAEVARLEAENAQLYAGIRAAISNITTAQAMFTAGRGSANNPGLIGRAAEDELYKVRQALTGLLAGNS